MVAHVNVCLPVALFLVYMVTHGASPRYHGARSDYKYSVYIDASLSGLHGYPWS